MLAEDKNLDLTRNRHMAALWNRFSIQGVKSIWGIIFPRLGTRDTDKGLYATSQCLWCPILEKQRNPPKVI